MAGYFEPDSARPFDPSGIVVSCIESGSRGVLLDGDALPPEFFDLSSRIAGELLHRLSIYNLRLAAVVADPGAYSEPFQDFIREANRGRRYRFFASREEAVDWLEGA